MYGGVIKVKVCKHIFVAEKQKNIKQSDKAGELKIKSGEYHLRKSNRRQSETANGKDKRRILFLVNGGKDSDSLMVNRQRVAELKKNLGK